MAEIELNDLQKLAANYLQAVGQLMLVSKVSGNIVGLNMANHHYPLIRSILGENIIKTLGNSGKAKKITRQAEDFYDLMVGDDDGGLEDSKGFL